MRRLLQPSLRTSVPSSRSTSWSTFNISTSFFAQARFAFGVYKLSYNSDNTMDSLRQELGKLGLGRHEAMIYAALVERSPCGASSIAKACGLSRSSVYTTLQSLADKGLVATTHR